MSSKREENGKKKHSSQRPDSDVVQEKKCSQLWIWAGLIILTTAITYSNSINNGFVNWDDDLHVYANHDIKNLDGPAIRTFFTNFYAKMYAPVTIISYAIDYKIGGIDPAVYHRTNLILHLLNVALVFFFLYRLTGQKAVAVISALFFGIHPFHVESVAWISERKDLLYVFFYLGGLIAWIGRRDEKRPLIFYFMTLFLFILSLLSKSAAVTFPLILMLIDFYRDPHSPRSYDAAGIVTFIKNHLDKIPFLLLSIVFGLLSLLSQKVIGAEVDYVTGYTITDRIFLGTYAFAFYLIKSIFPWNLSALHTMPTKPDGFLPLSYYLSIFVAIGFVVLLLKLIREYRRGVRQVSIHADREGAVIYKDILFGLLFFLFTVSLILFIPVGLAVVAERYTYISYIGIFIILGRLYLYFYQTGSARRRYGLTAAVAAAAILFSCMTYTRNQVWKDSMTLFSDMIEKNPDAGLAYNNRGNLRMEQEDFEGAIEDFNKAIELKDTNAHYNRGILRLRLGDYQNALDDFNLAEQNLRVDKAKVLYNLGITKLNLGDFRGAEEDFSGVIRINPRHAGAWSNRGLIRYDKLSDIMGAITDLDEAVSLDPDDPYIRYNRGNARMLAGKTTESLADYDRTLELMPLFAAVHLNKGAALLQSGRIDEACRSWEKAAELGEKAAGGLTAKYCKGNR